MYTYIRTVLGCWLCRTTIGRTSEEPHGSCGEGSNGKHCRHLSDFWIRVRRNVRSSGVHVPRTVAAPAAMGWGSGDACRSIGRNSDPVALAVAVGENPTGTWSHGGAGTTYLVYTYSNGSWDSGFAVPSGEQRPSGGLAVKANGGHRHRGKQSPT